MNRRDYVKIAEAMRQSEPVVGDAKYATNHQIERARHAQWEHDCTLLADMFQHDNPLFNRTKFLTACNYFKRGN